MTAENPYAKNIIGLELKILQTFQPLLTESEVTSYLAGNIDRASYHPRLLEIIEALEKKMNIVYNVDVATSAKLLGIDGPKLDMLVYNSQRYYSAQRTLTRFTAHLETIQADGFVLVSQQQADALLQRKTLVEVYLTPTQLINARLNKSNTNGYCWMMPRYKTRGYPARINEQYIRLPKQGKKPVDQQTLQTLPLFEA